ncbi:hypothetical protein EV424DRAFT_1542392 [Suillus variegatus]|nr:hypothetical protein EV424DRAFT_1542392 [Suillus variegatus]
MSTESILINGTDQVIIHDNVIVMDIENLLTGWPTYEIKFTPENPGPLKLIIRLKDPVKMSQKEKDRSREQENQNFSADTVKITEDLGRLKITSQSSGNNSVKAKPVRLLGARTNPQPRKLKFDSSTTWPPRRPHRFRDMQDKDSIAGLILQAVPAPVKADLT